MSYIERHPNVLFSAGFQRVIDTSHLEAQLWGYRSVFIRHVVGSFFKDPVVRDVWNEDQADRIINDFANLNKIGAPETSSSTLGFGALKLIDRAVEAATSIPLYTLEIHNAQIDLADLLKAIVTTEDPPTRRVLRRHLESSEVEQGTFFAISLLDTTPKNEIVEED